MIQYFTENPLMISLGMFVGIFALMGILETLFPRKVRTQPRFKRWANNLTIVVIYSVLVRIIFPVTAITTAMLVMSRDWGLLNMLDMPVWLHIVLSIIVLDFAIYWQHVASHKIPMIWAFHKMHHADRDIDVSTGSRFHPIEIGLSMLYKMLVILILGPVVIGVFIFEIIVSSSSMFNHANVKLPLWLDRVLRVLVVTPDMHRVHHSTVRRETDSNYGFFLSIWDKLFGSYIDQPEAGHDGVTIGLAEYQTDKPSHLLWCLILPFNK